MKLIALAVLASLVAFVPANAALYTFSYATGGGTLAGTLDGTLQGDNNTLVVNSVFNLTFHGVATPAMTLLSDIDYLNTGIAGTPMLSLNGSLMNFLACDDMNCSEGFLFTDGGGINSPVYAGTTAFGGGFYSFDASAWSISAAVAEPASWAMLIAGFGLTGAAMRRRRTAVAV